MIPSLTIKIENPEALRDYIADITCWWDGYTAGQRGSGNYGPSKYDTAIHTLQIFRQQLQEAINKLP